MVLVSIGFPSYDAMKSFTWFTTLLILCLELAHATHVSRSGSGFPSLGFKMPSKVPSSLDGWWSDYKSDLGFLGFSYWVTSCTFPSAQTHDPLPGILTPCGS